MPDYKIYIPEGKAAVLYQYKEQFGKDASGMIVSFMENTVRNSGSPEPKNSSADEIYETYFGDILTAGDFTDLLGGRQKAENAIVNRSDRLYRQHPGIYSAVIAKFKEKHPNFAKIKGIKT